MGSYLFRWTQPAETVSVTGNFANCNWSNSIRLNKEGDAFEKQIHFDSADEPIYYKFIVDGIWKADTTKPTKLDVSGNTNNVLSPKDIEKSPSSTATPASSGGGAAVAGAGAVVAGAAAVGASQSSSSSKDMASSEDKMPGAFPEATPANEPGPFHYSSYTDAKPAESGAESSPSDEQAYGVNPIPASEGHGNPVKLAPGEPVPPASEVTSNNLQSNVTTDKESYEKAGSSTFSGIGGIGAAVGGVAAAAAGAVGLSSLASKDPSHFAHHDPTGPDSTQGNFSGDHSAGYTPNALKEDSKNSFHQDPTGPNATHGSSAGGVAAGVTGAATAAAGAVGLSSSSSKFDHDDPTGPNSTHGSLSGDFLSGYKPNTLKQSSKEAFSDDPTGPNTTHGTSLAASAGTAVTGAAATAAGAVGLSKFDHHDPVGPSAIHGTTLGDRSSGYKPNELKSSSHETFHSDPTGPDSTHGTSSAGYGLGAGAAAVGVGGTIAAGAAGVASYLGFGKKSDKVIPESGLPMGADGTTPVEKDEGPVIKSAAGENTSTSALAGQVPLEPRGVPQVVSDSQAEAGAPLEASQSTTAVEDKSAVENELKEKVPEEKPTSENKGLIAGAAAGAGAAAVGGLAFASQKAGVPQSIQDKISSMNGGTSQPSDDVPRPVAESYEKSSQEPEAAANTEAVHEKADVERELLKDIKPTDATGEPAPVTTASTSAVAPGAPTSGSSALATESTAPTSSAAPSTAAAGATALAPGSTAPSSSVAPHTAASASKDSGVSGGLVAGAAGAGVGAAALGAGAYALGSHGSDSQGVSSSIRDPTTIPSTDPNVMIADEDTMPAIAMANRSAPADPSAPLAGSSSIPAGSSSTPTSSSSIPTSSSAVGQVQQGSVPASAYSEYTPSSAVPYTGATSGVPTSGTALADRSVQSETSSSIPTTSTIAGTSGAEASKPLAAPEDAPATVSQTPATAIAARVFGSPASSNTTSTAAPVISESSASRGVAATESIPTSTTAPVTSTSTSAASVSKGVSDGGPASTSGSSVPPTTSSTVGSSSAAQGTTPHATGSSATRDAAIGGAGATAVGGAVAAATSGTSTSASTSTPTKSLATDTGATGTSTSATTSTPTKSLATDAGDASKENRKPGQAPTMNKVVPSAREEAESGNVFGKEGTAKAAERDVSPFSKNEAGPSSSTTTPSKAAPSTPQKGAKTPTTGTPASAGTSGTAKSEKRRSRLSQWFSEHVGSERKSKKTG